MTTAEWNEFYDRVYGARLSIEEGMENLDQESSNLNHAYNELTMVLAMFQQIVFDCDDSEKNRFVDEDED